MPYADLPARDLRMFYVINPLDPIEYSSMYMVPGEPRCAPLDPMKPVVVFIPGLSLATASFRNQFADERLKNAFNLVSLDLRFNGRTSRLNPEEVESSPQDLGDDIIALLDLLQLDSYAIFAEAIIGTRAGIWVTVKRPEKVTCFMMVSPGSPDPRNRKTNEEVVKLVQGAIANKSGRGDGSGNIPDQVVAGVSSYFFGVEERFRARREEHAAALQLRYGAGTPENELQGMLQMVTAARDISDELVSTISCPVLILHGGSDSASPIAEVHKWQDLMTGVPNGGADARKIVGAPHILSFCESSIVNRILVSFVSRSVEQQSEGRWRTGCTNYTFGFRQADIISTFQTDRQGLPEVVGVMAL